MQMTHNTNGDAMVYQHSLETGMEKRPMGSPKKNKSLFFME